jgi:molybdate transport system substrate-binding protein
MIPALRLALFRLLRLARGAGVALALAASMAPVLAQQLTIAAASDLRFALDELLLPLRAANTGARIDVVYGSSGKITTQIRNGAPFDLFLSADVAYAQELHDAGLTLAAPAAYAVGGLVLWTLDPALRGLTLAQVVASPAVRRLAIANPQHAPYGERAMQALQSQGLWDAAQPKLVRGENVAQAAQFVDSGAAQAGLVARSLVLAPNLAGRGHWTPLPQAWHEPLVQGYVVLRRAAGNPLAAAFERQLRSEASLALLRRYGFGAPPPAPARAQ